MEWIWADEKNRINKRDHRLSFEIAEHVFDDPLAVSRVDPHPDGDRWQTVGMVGTVALFVVHTWPDTDPLTGNEVGRIISALRRHHMKGKRMKKDSSRSLTQAQAEELKALSALPDDKINTQEMPERRDWSDAKRGVFYRPIKKQLTLRLDADVLDWFKSHASNGEGYQTSINSALREYVARHEHK